MVDVVGGINKGDAATAQKIAGQLMHGIFESTIAGGIDTWSVAVATFTDDRRLRVDALISGGSGTTVSKNKAFTVTTALVNVGAGASAQVLAPNSARVWARIYQTSAGLVHYQEGAAATASGTPLNGRGAGHEIGPDNFWDGAVSIFNTTASPVNISVVEGTNP